MNRIEKKFEIRKFWDAIVHQKETEIKKYFNKTAIIRQPNTNEEFSLEEFIEANCKYPGKWDGEIERIKKGENNSTINPKPDSVIEKGTSLLLISEIEKVKKISEIS